MPGQGSLLGLSCGCFGRDGNGAGLGGGAAGGCSIGFGFVVGCAAAVNLISSPFYTI